MENAQHSLRLARNWITLGFKKWITEVSIGILVQIPTYMSNMTASANAFPLYYVSSQLRGYQKIEILISIKHNQVDTALQIRL